MYTVDRMWCVDFEHMCVFEKLKKKEKEKRNELQLSRKVNEEWNFKDFCADFGRFDTHFLVSCNGCFLSSFFLCAHIFWPLSSVSFFGFLLRKIREINAHYHICGTPTLLPFSRSLSAFHVCLHSSSFAGRFVVLVSFLKLSPTHAYHVLLIFFFLDGIFWLWHNRFFYAHSCLPFGFYLSCEFLCESTLFFL